MIYDDIEASASTTSSHGYMHMHMTGTQNTRVLAFYITIYYTYLLPTTSLSTLDYLRRTLAVLTVTISPRRDD